ncbi:AAA family ATPase [Butyricimonas faecihominis]|uniref:AAA family ATPase n=1 Tax=Butyricimonas faecihominis TaxID=1472416 RepID=UPI0032C05EFF
MEKTDTMILSPEELAAYMEESTISVTSTYEHSPVVLMVDDTIIGTLGNFSASIGKAKSKKTFNVSAIVASALNNSTVLHYRSTFPENKRKILYIDTEQGRYHCQQVLKRILHLADLPEYKNPDNLIMLALRKFSPKLRMAIVEQAIGKIPDLGLVIIDGIRDFLYDINSSSESTDIISKFMQWTDDRQIHIHTVLHQNKNDEHARGHIGTELNNKAETIMQIEVDKEDKTVSVVEAVHIRDREFEPFAFRINEEAIPELVEAYLPKEKKIGRPTKEPFEPYKEIPENVHQAALNAAFANGNISNYNDYLEQLKIGYGLQDVNLGHNKVVKVATFLRNKRMVIKVGKEYKINPECHY